MYQVAFSVLDSCIGVEACTKVVQYFFVIEIPPVPCRDFPRVQQELKFWIPESVQRLICRVTSHLA